MYTVIQSEGLMLFSHLLCFHNIKPTCFQSPVASLKDGIGDKELSFVLAHHDTDCLCNDENMHAECRAALGHT